MAIGCYQSLAMPIRTGSDPERSGCQSLRDHDFKIMNLFPIGKILLSMGETSRKISGTKVLSVDFIL